MKHKKDTTNVKSVNKPSKSPEQTDTTNRMMKEVKSTSSDCHQDIVKRLMTHSQYFPSNPNSQPVSVTYSSIPSTTYHHTPLSMTSSYSHYQHPLYEASQPFTDYYSKDYYYQPQQHQTFNQFANINTCLSPSLSSPSTLNNFDQVSDGSPSNSGNNNYVFNGDFTLNFNSEFDGSFPLIDAAKTQQLFDDQAPLEIKSFEVGSMGQLTPVTIESERSDGIKSSFDDVKRNSTLVNLCDDDVLSVTSGSSRPSPSGTVDWKFVEHQ